MSFSVYSTDGRINKLVKVILLFLFPARVILVGSVWSYFNSNIDLLIYWNTDLKSRTVFRGSDLIPSVAVVLLLRVGALQATASCSM